MSATRTKAGRERQPSGAETARKVLKILLYFRRDRATATVRELAEQASISIATAHRYVALLREMGFLEEAGRASYRLSWRVALLGQTASAVSGLFRTVEPIMRRVASELGETVSLLALTDDAMECLGQVESEHLVRLSFTPGHHFPLTAGASARILLASLPAHDRKEILDALARDDSQFAARRQQFERDIAAAADLGWAMSHEEIDPGIWAVAAPVQVESQTIASLSVAGFDYRLDDGEQERVARVTRAAAEEMSALLSDQTSV